MAKAVENWIKAVNLKPVLFDLLPPDLPPEIREKIRRGFPVSISSIPIGNKKGSSPLSVENNRDSTNISLQPGGIDFRLLLANQPVLATSLTGFNNVSSVSSPIINLDERREEIEKMLETGFVPSFARIKEYLQVSLQQEDPAEGISLAISCIARIFRLEEEYAIPTDNNLKELLVLLQS
jgi:hypothetical protein